MDKQKIPEVEPDGKQPWDSFFQDGPSVSEDFQRAEQDSLVDSLREHLPPQVQAAAIFDARAVDNELNLLLIAEELSGLRAQALLAPVGRELGRSIEVHLCSAAEWSERLAAGDVFLQEILSGHLVMVCGELHLLTLSHGT